jgi:hypothetical protein
MQTKERKDSLRLQKRRASLVQIVSDRVLHTTVLL